MLLTILILVLLITLGCGGVLYGYHHWLKF